MRVFTREDNKLAIYEVDTTDYKEAIDTVKHALGSKHKAAVLVRIK